MSHGLCLRKFRTLALGATLFSLLAGPALAGAPFQTDDPEPTDYRHFEIYFATDYTRTADGVSGTLPHSEIDYGVMPNVEFALTLPMAGFQQSHNPMHFGLGDIELGLKIRVLQESKTLPQIAIGPTIDLPTGNATTGLGAGLPKAFFPIWAEKGFGRYTVYGGGGLWHNSGDGNKNYTFSGLAVERDMGRGFTLGTEFFNQSADTIGGRSTFGFTLGAVKDIDEHHKILFSLGRSLSGTSTFSGYAAYELFLGPREKPDAEKADDDKPDADKPDGNKADSDKAGTQKADTAKAGTDKAGSGKGEPEKMSDEKADSDTADVEKGDSHMATAAKADNAKNDAKATGASAGPGKP